MKLGSILLSFVNIDFSHDLSFYFQQYSYFHYAKFNFGADFIETSEKRFREKFFIRVFFNQA